MKKFYVYVFLREDRYTPYYVGKGTGRRCYSNSNRKFPVPKDKSRIQKIFCTNDEQKALDVERIVIKFWGRKIDGGVLYNILEGDSIAEFNPEIRKRQSTAAKIKWTNPEYRDKQCIALSKAAKGHPGNTFRKGMKNSPEHIKILSQCNKDRAKVYTITKGETTLHMPITEFCELYNYSQGSCRVRLQKVNHYKGWTFS